MKYQERFNELQKDTELADDAMLGILSEEFPRKKRATIIKDLRNRKVCYEFQGSTPIHD